MLLFLKLKLVLKVRRIFPLFVPHWGTCIAQQHSGNRAIRAFRSKTMFPKMYTNLLTVALFYYTVIFCDIPDNIINIMYNKILDGKMLLFVTFPSVFSSTSYFLDWIFVQTMVGLFFCQLQTVRQWKLYSELFHQQADPERCSNSVSKHGSYPICEFGFHAAGFQDRPHHRHEGARFTPAEPRRLLRACRPMEAGVGERGPGSCQPPVHPTARRQVTQRQWLSLILFCWKSLSVC